MLKQLIVVAIAACAIGCGPPDMKREEVMDTLFGSDKGVVGGYDFGDSWDDIKKDPNKLFKVRDEAGFEQLRRAVSDNAGDNGYYIGFNLDDAKKVKSFNASISGKKQNAVTVRKLVDDVIAHFDKKVGSGKCNKGTESDTSKSTHCDWIQPGKPIVSMMYMTFKEPIGGLINLDIKPPK